MRNKLKGKDDFYDFLLANKSVGEMISMLESVYANSKDCKFYNLTSDEWRIDIGDALRERLKNLGFDAELDD